MKIDWYLCILLCSNCLYPQQFSNYIGAPKNRDLSSGCWGNVIKFDIKFEMLTLVYQVKAQVQIAVVFFWTFVMTSNHVNKMWGKTQIVQENDRHNIYSIYCINIAVLIYTIILDFYSSIFFSLYWKKTINILLYIVILYTLCNDITYTTEESRAIVTHGKYKKQKRVYWII